MTDYGPYKVHPLAGAFPLIQDEEFDALVEDIRENGLGRPITLTSDKSTIVDGRNRYRACDAANVDPNFDYLPASFSEEQIGDFIRSENLYRRHLTAGQKDYAALTFLEYFAGLAKERQGERTDLKPKSCNTAGLKRVDNLSADLHEGSDYERRAATQAAKKVGASGRGVAQAKFVRDNASDLAEEVKAGKLAIDNAYKQAQARVAEQRKREPVPEKPKPHRAEPVMLSLRTHTGDEVAYPQPVSRSTFNSTPGEGISWAAWSWNPVTGCLHGCDYCYAREIATSERYKAAYPAGFTPLYHPERLQAPANTRPTDGAGGNRVFVCSMADLYGRWVPDEWIESVHAVERDNPQWEYLHLTKFPDRYPDLDLPATAWIGTSVDEQSRVRIAERAFSKITDVKVKWLSLEPLLGPLEFTDLSMFDWVVIGAQTGTTQPGGRYVPPLAPDFEWVADIVRMARESGCKVHMKPNLHHAPGMKLLDEYPDGTT